jgi:integrase/recombinase XerD
MNPKRQQANPLRLLSSNETPSIACIHCSGTDLKKDGKNKSSETQIYLCRDCKRSFTPKAAKPIFIVDPQKEYEKDIWDCRSLGLSSDVGKTCYRLNFSSISQPWMKQTAKLHLKVCLASLTFGSSQERLYCLRRLSGFFQKRYPNIDPSEIGRSEIVELAIYLTGEGLSEASRSKILSSAKLYFDACHQNQWLNISRYLVRSEDFPKIPKRAPRYIPEEVMTQLNEHLGDLAPPVMRMVLILQECGMRISELVNLKLDCLLQDKSGDWFLRYYQFKMKKEITIPISREIVRVVQEQTRFIRKTLSMDFAFLFCANGGAKRPGFNPVESIMSRKILGEYLNALAKTRNICDQTGKVWHFQSHQFRHTVGTRMINNGVPQHIIQRYLGHETPDMTSQYAQIHDQTMKEAIAKFQGKVVNVAGQVVASNVPEIETLDLAWFKRNIQAQALPNGSCALPTISQGCPHANACLTCTHFRTTAEFLDEHRKQLEETEKILSKAVLNGWVRQVEMNEKVAVNLRNIVTTLEGQSHE